MKMYHAKNPVKTRKDSGLSYRIMIKNDDRREKISSIALLNHLDWDKTALFTQADYEKKYHLGDEETSNTILALKIYIDLIYSDKTAPVRIFIGNTSNDFGILSLQVLLEFKQTHPDLLIISMQGGMERPCILPGLPDSLLSLEDHRHDSIVGITTDTDHIIHHDILHVLKTVITKSRYLITDKSIYQFKPGVHGVPSEIVEYYQARKNVSSVNSPRLYRPIQSNREP